MKFIEYIKEAEQKKIAIGHFNIGNLEQLKAIANVGIKLNVPLIIGVSEGEREYLGTQHVADFVASYNKIYGKEGGFHLYLNADHTHSLEKIEEAVRAGFDAVLFDGGKLPIEENIRLTKEAVRVARSINPDIVIEGELGYIGSSSQIFEKIPDGAEIGPDQLTSVESAKRFVLETGVDLLAPAVGNVHGMYANMKNPHIDSERIKSMKHEISASLVLHGGSGVSDDDFIAAINAGVSIIHISTELRYVWRTKLEAVLREHPMEIAPSKIMPELLNAIEDVVEKRVRLFFRM
ncbi:class II fructose-bisphosphate aldolase [Candidatus Parcubacteria bacterium]|jgi:fructose-bisphosphate aldolase class II|nr:MAG: class II fructose-bisphosphate aldolase [Candidatus Parcubacteria bacterium]